MTARERIIASTTAGLLAAAGIPLLLVALFLGYLLFLTVAGRSGGMTPTVSFAPVALLMAVAFVFGFAWRFLRLTRR
jgi:uncharacterized RDD family membrane protein YckC